MKLNWRLHNFLKKNNPVGALIPVSPGQPKVTPRNYTKLSKEGYEKNNVCFSAVKMVATNCSQVKFCAKTKDGNTIENHPVLALLNQPNPMTGRAEFIQSVISYRLLNGNSYINAVSPNAGQAIDAPAYDFEPAELWANRADKYRVIQGTTAPVAGYEYTGSLGKKAEFPADQVTGQSNVLHWKTFHPTDDYYGLSAIEASAAGIDIYNLSMDWNNAFFANGARPSGMFMWKGDGQMSDKAYNRLKKDVDELYTGPGDNGKPLVGDGLMEYIQFSLSPKDMDFIQAKDTTAKDISRAFGVPPILLNIGSDSTFNNQGEARLALWEDTVIPTMNSLVTELNSWLMPRYKDDAVIVLDLSEVAALEPKREQAWKRAGEADFLTINEKRKLVGYNEVDGGDDVLISATQIPLTFEEFSTDDARKAVSRQALGKSFTEFKLIDGSRRAEQREQAIQDRLMSALERTFAQKIFTILQHYVNNAARELGKDPKMNIDVLLAGMNSDLQKIYEQQYKSTFIIFGERTIDGLKALSSECECKQDVDDVFLQAAEEWIEDNAATRVAMVTDTTRDLIRDGVMVGLEAGATGTQMAATIRDKAGETISRTRAIVIARTETHMASQAGSLAAANASGIELRKVWIAAADERTRETHNATDAESHANPVDKDGLFQVGADSMAAPGMGSLAEENVNCRCVLGFVSV